MSNPAAQKQLPNRGESSVISIDDRESVAEATAFRLGIHEELSKVTGSCMMAAAGCVERGTIFCVLRFTGWPDRADNGWKLITAPDHPNNHRLIEDMLLASYTAAPIIKPIPQPGRI
jgi:hypothetical protein